MPKFTTAALALALCAASLSTHAAGAPGFNGTAWGSTEAEITAANPTAVPYPCKPAAPAYMRCGEPAMTPYKIGSLPFDVRFDLDDQRRLERVRLQYMLFFKAKPAELKAMSEKAFAQVMEHTTASFGPSTSDTSSSKDDDGGWTRWRRTTTWTQGDTAVTAKLEGDMQGKDGIVRIYVTYTPEPARAEATPPEV